MGAAACIALGYFTGTINPAFIFSKLKGFDVRTRGSGNAGATNAFLTLGKVFGVLCALLDILKAFFAFKIAKMLFPTLDFAGILSGTACIIGHIFPVWLNFRGGKGLACIGGVIFAFNWKVFCVMLVFEVALALVLDYICVITMTVSVIFPVVYVFLTRDLIGMLALLIVAVVVELKHMDNIHRIREGKELHISYLWNKEKEIERLTKVMGEERVDELV